MKPLLLLTPLLGACTFLVGEAHPEDAAISFPDFSTACDPALLSVDVRNCGVCGRDCTRLPGVEPNRVRCLLGACDLTGACQIARGDCNSTDGCETDFSRSGSCGGCGIACSGVAPRCIGTATGSYTCAVTCGGTTPTQCGSDCANLDTDPQHCGACFNACPAPLNGFAVCDFFGCNFDCNPGFVPSGTQCLATPMDMSIPRDMTVVRDLRMVDLRMVDMARTFDLSAVDLASTDLAGLPLCDCTGLTDPLGDGNQCPITSTCVGWDCCLENTLGIGEPCTAAPDCAPSLTPQ